MLDTLAEIDIILNEDECIYGVDELQILGHTLSANGIKPDADRLEAIRKFRALERRRKNKL